MSIRPLILKDGVYTIPRSSTDTSSLLVALGLNLVNNTSDLSKPISTATQTALDLKANLASPNLSGTPTVPTAVAGTNTTQAASTAFVSTAISNLVASSPAALDTLNELAAALGNDANFATTVTNSLVNKVDLTANQSIGGIKTFTGGLLLPATSGTSIGTIWRNVDNLEYKDSVSGTRILLSNTGNLSNVANKQTALNNLVGTQTANRVLRSNGTNITLSLLALDTDVTNVLSIINGGTGSPTQNFVDLTTNQTVGGNKTLSSVVIVPNTTYGFNIDPISDVYNTCRFTASDASYWDFGVSPVTAGKVFYISSGTAGGGITGFQINANNYNISASGVLTITNTTAATSSTTGSGKFAGGIGVVGKGCFGGGLNLTNLPTSNSGLTTGDVWRNGNVLTIV